MGIDLYASMPEKFSPFKHLFEYHKSELMMNVFLFSEVILKEQIGDFAVGTKFPRATLHCNSGKLVLCDKLRYPNPLILCNEDLFNEPTEGYHQFRLKFSTT